MATDQHPGLAARPYAVPPWNPLAILAFVLVFVVPPGAIACGHIALAQIRRSGEQGHGLALAGTVLGYVFTGFLLLVVLLWVAFAVAFFSTFFGVLGAIHPQAGFPSP